MAANVRRRYRIGATTGLVLLTVGWGMGLAAVLSRSKSPLASLSASQEMANLGGPSGLPLPSSIPETQFEEQLYHFLNTRGYAQLGWLHDKGVRDTGPFLEGQSYGTHPAVRVYYSPGVIRWLLNGRVGKIPDGEMIVKEQYAAPAVRHRGQTEQELWEALESWTVMVKDSAGSQDGWYWSNPAKGQCVVDRHQPSLAYPLSGFGLYCIRCHAATQSPGAEVTGPSNEFTFASLRNVAGFPGKPLQFPVDDSWLPEKQPGKAGAGQAGATSDEGHPKCPRPRLPQRQVPDANQPFLNFFSSIRLAGPGEVVHLPPATQDWVVSRRDPTQDFITSNQCMNCHAGLLAPFGPTMFFPTEGKTEYGTSGWDVSPYGEWRWTPMGLAGRDPVFYAQLESEERLLAGEFRSDQGQAKRVRETLVDTCLRCHGAMGKRQFDLDHPEGDQKFSLDQVLAVPGPHDSSGHGGANYGALAREGVGCMVCHRMQAPVQPREDQRPYLQYFLETSSTGNFHLGPKGEIYGPFKNEEIAPYAMEHATAWKPGQGTFLKSSQLCGTCHTVALPALGKPLDRAHAGEADEMTKCEAVPLFRGFHHHVEQATYLEWLNSAYENEVHRDNPQARSCQDCHMARGLKDEAHGIDLPRIRTRIAAIEDTTYPEAENLAPRDRLNVRIRDEGFRRHNFAGLNLFLLELFRQFDDVLGVPTTDFMTGSPEEIARAAEGFIRTARADVASLEVAADWEGPNRVSARVVVTNKVGHRFPSGVGFRRAFLELLVVQEEKDRPGSERVVWSSGRTNELGVLVGADGRPLPTEFFARDPVSGRQLYQKHHEVITSPDQVQVYETLRRDVKGAFTTSFVLGCETVKDNRLLPRGWKREGPGPGLTGSFLGATQPDPETARDPRYADGSGSDEVTYRIELPRGVDPGRLRVRATLYYQALPPYYLRNLFETAPDGPATRRLHYLCSHVNLRGTPLEDWKLRITSAACEVRPRSPAEAKPIPSGR
ncbi:MAG: hypothetical protein JO112_03310 [Planctomycetes bacterium]|nr:hypothetical protein [Planctomycetota bacterium]